MKVVKIILGVLLGITILAVIFGDSDTETTTTTTTTTAAAQQEEQAPTSTVDTTTAPPTTQPASRVYGIGEIDFQSTGSQSAWIDSIEVSTGNDLDEPAEGNVWVIVNVTVENRDPDAYQSGLFDFELRSPEGVTYDMAIFADTTGDINGTILFNKALKAGVAFEVPVDVKTVELYWSSNIFVYDPVVWTLEIP